MAYVTDRLCERRLLRFCVAVVLSFSMASPGLPFASQEALASEADSGSQATCAKMLGDAEDYRQGSFIAVTRESVDEQDIEAAILPETSSARTLGDGGASCEVEEIANGSYLVSCDSDDCSEQVLEALLAMPEVEYVQPDYEYELPEDGLAEAGSEIEGSAANSSAWARSLEGTNDPLLGEQWYLDAVGLPDAWRLATSEDKVSIAMIDQACDLEHEDLKGSLDAEHAWDAVTQSPMSNESSTLHGTSVAGVLSAVSNNGVGISGSSYNANVIPVNVFSSGDRPTASTSSIVRALAYVGGLVDSSPEMNIRVVNMSLGGYSELSSSGSDALLHQSIVDLRNKGVAIVGAGGNEARTDFSWPSDWDEVISVTALDRDAVHRASFSDYNQYKDIAAPGVDILTTYGGSSPYYSVRGTSFSAPLVSGTLALMFAANPSLTVDEATAILLSTCDDLGESGCDDEFGYGRLDAASAVEAASSMTEHASEAYSDVDQNAWYQQPIGYIDYAVQEKVLLGSNGLFRPDDSMTRAEAVTALWRICCPEDAASYDSKLAYDSTNAPGAASFEWYTGAVNWAYSRGILNGYDNGSLGLSDAVTVEQMCCMMASCFAESKADVSGSTAGIDAYSDAGSISDYAVGSVSWCTLGGIVSGYSTSGGRILDPQGFVSRARFSGFAYNAAMTGLSKKVG